MHFTGTIWRPPYEAESLLLEVTAGCSWHRCKFCTLYNDLPFPFRMSPLEDIKADLTEAQMPIPRLESWGSSCWEDLSKFGGGPILQAEILLYCVVNVCWILPDYCGPTSRNALPSVHLPE